MHEVAAQKCCQQPHSCCHTRLLTRMYMQEGGAAAAAAAPPPAAADDSAADSAAEPIDTWSLPENTGRAYAALDGDISPMHLYKATAMLMGFPAPVANVHFLAARTEATIDTKVAGVLCVLVVVVCCVVKCVLGSCCWLMIQGIADTLCLYCPPHTNITHNNANTTQPGGAGGPIAPLSMELEFKKPTLLPNKLTLSGQNAKAFAQDAAAGE